MKKYILALVAVLAICIADANATVRFSRSVVVTAAPVQVFAQVQTFQTFTPTTQITQFSTGAISVDPLNAAFSVGFQTPVQVFQTPVFISRGRFFGPRFIR